MPTERYRRWMKTHPERANELRRASYRRNCQTERARRGRYVQKLRQEVIAKYGGACACCGVHDYRFLCIDHKHEDGNAERRTLPTGTAFYRQLRDGAMRSDLQVLCFNCNMAKTFYGECPHVSDLR